MEFHRIIDDEPSVFQEEIETPKKSEYIKSQATKSLGRFMRITSIVLPFTLYILIPLSYAIYRFIYG